MLTIKLPKEEKAEIIRSVQAYFEEERSESIGELAADQLVDFMIEALGPFIYNKALDDSRQVINEKMLQLEDELYVLEKPTQNRKR
ncbi:Uncharacterized conserved protein, DUF2164 family [Fontibacillus panacisegetis]|uniref:Uncharacterized conserved protein, DUF2164 family n=1 Tax=Fontibacillus panacisegetis TaxID=670482 RepID=A0A1G7NYG1_9BACL|nr:DUF2164 domain-containing protein [Fontibacillus panacisegetis]SDF79072.1 Uncharacterized conserved protein, DUF2164 family [Fontibacillus panacisegetis]